MASDRSIMLLFINNLKIRLVLLAIIPGLISPGCVAINPNESRALVVAAASDLAKIAAPLAEAFERAHGSGVAFSFGASGQLEQQIRQGAPFDLYAPAALSYCESLQRDGFLAGECKVYALGRLVVWSGNLAIRSLAELEGAGTLRIALANPRYAPYGRAAQQALEAAGLWENLRGRIVYADSVAHAFQMAETGNADAALVARSLVRDEGGNVLDVDPTLHQPIEQTVAVLRSSSNQEAARIFADFLLSPEARGILEAYGFVDP
ncbi:MAG: molybdate ABC transporter substrate-binding protein [Terriglobia bacterium]